MNDLLKGRVYKIVCSISDIVYIGSTFNTLRGRLQQHKYTRNSKKGRPIISKYMRELGCEKFKILLIKEYNVIDRNHLRAYEQLWINKTKNTINIINSVYMLKKHHDRLYRLNNKERFQKQAKEYSKKNKERIANYQKEYDDKNKDKKKEYDREYRRKNREKIKKNKKEYAEKNKKKIAKYHSEYYKNNKDKWT